MTFVLTTKETALDYELRASENLHGLVENKPQPSGSSWLLFLINFCESKFYAYTRTTLSFVLITTTVYLAAFRLSSDVSCNNKFSTS